MKKKKNKLSVCNKDESTYICRLIELCIIIVENTQAQYVDNLTRNCRRVFSTMTIHSCKKVANIKALFLATYTEPILVFVRKTK